MMDASGVTSSAEYGQIQFDISEYEEELEQRDMSNLAKGS